MWTNKLCWKYGLGGIFCIGFIQLYNTWKKLVSVKNINNDHKNLALLFNTRDAETYENLLKQEIFVSIENKRIKGYRGIQLLKRHLANEVEFTTIMWCDNIDSVRQFAGEVYGTAYVPAKARRVLLRFDEKAIHCEVRHVWNYNLQNKLNLFDSLNRKTKD